MLEQKGLGSKKTKVKTVILGSGKVMTELEDAIQKEKDQNFDWLHILRVEQIYPFPRKQVEEILARYKNVEEIVWVQEEPKNAGSWDFVKEELYNLLKDNQTLKYVGRPRRSSPAVGEPNVHKSEQNRIIMEALKLSKEEEINSERN